MSPRIDFTVPHDAQRGRCRYCLVTIYWARTVHNAPLDAASAVTVDGVVRMESHVAHCPNRARALANAKTQPCPGRGCRERIESGEDAPIMCPTCWELLPETIRTWVSREGRKLPRGRAFAEAVYHARKIAGRLRTRANRPPPQPTLFPGIEYG